MGLDQYGLKTPLTDDLKDIYAGEDARPEMQMICSWRKHPDLHGFMENLYFQKKQANEYVLPEGAGGSLGEFNCILLRLTPEDIDHLEQAVLNNDLPETSGFFFGKSMPEDRADDLAFIAEARQAFADGYAIYYDSWW